MLRRGQRDPLRPPVLSSARHGNERCQSTGTGMVLHATSKRGDRRGIEQGPHRHLCVQSCAQPGRNLRRDERVAAEREEVVVQTDPSTPRTLVKTSATICSIGGGRARTPPIRWTVRATPCGRACRNSSEAGRGVPRRPTGPYKPEAVLPLPPSGRGQRYQQHQWRVRPMRQSITTDRDHGLCDVIVGKQSALDLAQIDPLPAELDLEIGAADVVRVRRRSSTGQRLRCGRACPVRTGWRRIGPPSDRAASCSRARAARRRDRARPRRRPAQAAAHCRARRPRC